MFVLGERKCLKKSPPLSNRPRTPLGYTLWKL